MKKNQCGFGHSGILLLVVVLIAVGLAGYKVYKNQHKTDSSNNLSTTSNTKKSSPASKPATYKNTLTLKEWGIKVSFDDADKVTYKIQDSAGSVETSLLYLLSSVTADAGCQSLGLGINRAKPITDEAKTKAINGYVYDISGGPGACDGDPGGVDGSINQLRKKIIGDELGSSKYSITATE